MNILLLPCELLTTILCSVDYEDLVQFSKTCREAHALLAPSNHLIWQSAYLQKFDDPRDRRKLSAKPSEPACDQRDNTYDWFLELRKRVSALRWVRKGYASGLWDGQGQDNAQEQEDSRLSKVIETLLEIIDTAKVYPTDDELDAGRKAEVDDRALSKNLALLPTNYEFTAEFDGLVRGLPASVVKKNLGYGFSVNDAAVGMPGAWHVPGRPTTRSQAAIQWDKIVRSEAGSRLHVLSGLTKREESDEKALGRARRITYDWSSTDQRNEWGPLKMDESGEVDWRRMEAICTVVARQFSLAVRGRMILPQGFCFSIPYRTLSDPTAPDDWARAQGLWVGTYVFLHWEDLVEFNAFRNAANRPTLENGPEACGGLMKLELRLDSRLADDKKLRTDLPICEDKPPIFFSGISRSYDFQMATGIRGMACLAPGGREVRWRFIVQ